MKSTSDYRNTNFEISTIQQYGHDSGGLAVAAVERASHVRSAPIELSTEAMSAPMTGFDGSKLVTLNDLAIEFFTRLENLFADVFNGTPQTREEVHALVATAEEARKARAEAEAAAREADDRLTALNATTAQAERAAEAKLAELDAQIAAKRAEAEASAVEAASSVEAAAEVKS